MVKRRLGPFESDQVRLRLLEEADLPLTLAWRNQDEIRRWFLTSDRIAPERHRAWFDSYRARDDDFVFVIEARSLDDRPVGQVSLYRIDWEARTAEFGRLMIGEEAARGRGLAREATGCLLSAAFGEIGLREVVLEVLDDNEPALAIYRGCGFVVESHDGRSIRMACRATGRSAGAHG